MAIKEKYISFLFLTILSFVSLYMVKTELLIDIIPQHHSIDLASNKMKDIFGIPYNKN